MRNQLRFTGVGGQGVLLAGEILAAAKIGDGGFGVKAATYTSQVRGGPTKVDILLDENEIESIVLCSDGISEDIQKDKILDFFKGYVSSYKDINSTKRTKDIKHWLKNWPVKGHSDDKTIVALIKETNE